MLDASLIERATSPKSKISKANHTNEKPRQKMTGFVSSLRPGKPGLFI